MAIKKFTYEEGVTIQSDSRAIMTDTYLTPQIIKWCEETGVIATRQLVLPDITLWKVLDDSQRTLFQLKWAS